MPNVEFRSIGAASASQSGTSQAVATPSGFQAGDLLLTTFALGSSVGGAHTFPTTVPTGWSTLDTTTASAPHLSGAIYYKIATGSEGSTQTWSGWDIASNTLDAHVLQMMAFTGCDPINPIKSGEWSVSSVADGSGALTQNHPSVTPSVDGSAVIICRMKRLTAAGNGHFTSTITDATNPAGVERADSGATHPHVGTYTRDGGFGKTTQSYSTTSDFNASGADIMYSIILNAKIDFLPKPQVIDYAALQRASAW